MRDERRLEVDEFEWERKTREESKRGAAISSRDSKNRNEASY